ncbi:unnamed protein product [Amoebophrya sp. A25]|nr:unnamed protein product [Amoebophrya sp. A25]|eukprot:GSA25T00024812001.1
MSSSLEVKKQTAILEQREALAGHSFRNCSGVALVTKSNIDETVTWAKGFLDDSPAETLDGKGLALRSKDGFVQKLRLHGQDSKADLFERSWHEYLGLGSLSTTSLDPPLIFDEEAATYGILECLFALVLEPLTVPNSVVPALLRLRARRNQTREN